MWQRIAARLRPAPIDTVTSLRAFLEERSALIAQKCAIDYCRGKTGLASYALFTEKPFLDALDVCRWEAFVAVLADLLLLTEAELRRAASAEQRGRVCEALIGLYGAVLASLPPLRHRSDWAEAAGIFAARLRAASAVAPRRAVEVADHSAKRLFDTLPIHSSYRELDEEVVYGAVRFRMVAVNQEMQRRFAPAELVAALAGENVT